MIFFYKESKSNKKKNMVVGRGGGGGVARIRDFLFFPFFQKKNGFLFEGVKVREDWLV